MIKTDVVIDPSGKAYTFEYDTELQPIISFSGQYSYLSNFHTGNPTMISDMVIKTVEHEYQSAKCLNPSEYFSIIEADTPGKAKRIGSKVLLRPDWNLVKVKIMYNSLKRKFFQNPQLAYRLKSTGKKLLVEGNYWHDNFWGSCTCLKCSNKEKSNFLGKLLMVIREEL